MEAACIRHTDIPGTSKLFSDLLYQFDRVAAFYPSSPFDFPKYLDSAKAVEYPNDRRQAMVDALRAINPGSRLLDQFAEPGTAVVVTGQQVGLFGGPCYTLYKALTAISIARHMTDAGQPTVPVFWIATEDHDFAEIDHVWGFGLDRAPVRWTAAGSPKPQQPVGGVGIDRMPDGWRDLLRDLPFADEAIAMAERHYRAGESFGGAFRGFLREVLAPHEVLILDPLDPAIRLIGAAFLRQAALQARALTAAVAEQSRALIAGGYHAQVHFEGKDASLFFVLDGDRRTPLKNVDPAVHADQAERLSPNALLRPVWQDYLLPTAVMIGGPAEIAYLAQSAPLYENLLGRRPVATPRAAFTLFDARSQKLMDRYELRLPDLLTDNEAFRERIAEKLVPPQLKSAFEESRGRIEVALDQLERDLASFDPTLAAAAQKSRAKIAFQIEKAGRKVAREVQRREERESADSSYLANLIYPHRHPQERFYSILPFLAAHGRDLVDRIYENIHVSCPDHHVLPL